MKNETVFLRGDLVVCVLAGDYGKPRPAVVVQSDLFNGDHASIVICPLSSELTGFGAFRLPVPPSASTGLRKNSEVMVDKIGAVERSRIRDKIGHLSRPQVAQLNDALRLWLELP